MGQLVFQATLGGAVNLIGPNIAGTVNFTLPSADGTSGQALSTNGTGTLAFSSFATLVSNTFTGSQTLSAGTALGVNYLNASKVLTSGSVLTFDGANLGVLAGSVTSPSAKIHAVGNIRSSNTAGTLYSHLAYDGVYSTGTDVFLYAPTGYSNIFFANNAEGMRLTSTGLGIGTSSPAYKLHVATSGVASIAQFERTDSSAGLIIGADSDGPFFRAITTGDSIRWNNYNNTAEFMRLDSAGNLGLGVTPSAWNLGKAFEIGNVGNGIWGVGSGDVLMFEGAYYNSGWKYAATGVVPARYEMNAGVHSWHNAQSGTAGNAISFTQAMTLDALNNLGLGTTSPLGSFEIVRNTSSGSGVVYPNIRLDNQSSTGYTGLYFLNSGTNKAFLEVKNDVGALTIGTGGSERARIDSSGSLRLGLTGSIFSSTEKMSIQSASGAIGLAINASGSGSFGIAIYGSQASGATSQTMVSFANSSSTTVGSITANGTATLYNTTSDQRLKENIQNAESASSLIDSIQVRQFDWKADGNHQRYGFVAQELVTVAPEAVHQPTDTDEMMAVDYSKLVPMLVKEIQSLRQRLSAANI
jgi:hypothetical protein